MPEWRECAFAGREVRLTSSEVCRTCRVVSQSVIPDNCDCCPVPLLVEVVKAMAELEPIRDWRGSPREFSMRAIAGIQAQCHDVLATLPKEQGQ